jgi:hypothetical protein
MILYIPPENIADGDVHEIKVLSEHGALRALATALHAHNDVFPHAARLDHEPRRL